VAALDAGAAKPGDTAQTPTPKPTNAVMKIVRMSFSLLPEAAPTERLHGLAFADRVLRSEIRPAAPRRIRRSAPRQIARTATTNAIGEKLGSAVRTARG
jgi:hypothetical protein